MAGGAGRPTRRHGRRRPARPHPARVAAGAGRAAGLVGAGPGGLSPWPGALPAAAGRLAPPPPGQPLYLPQASWRWPYALAGLVVGAAPEMLLLLAAALGGGSGTGGAATAGSAALLAVSALVLYGWQALAAWLFSLRTRRPFARPLGVPAPEPGVLLDGPARARRRLRGELVHDVVVRPQQQQIVGEFPRTGAGAALFILVAVVMAPLFEEVFFRGFLFRGFANSWGWVWGALASAAIFGFAHLQLDVFVPLVALGFVLAWAYKRTGSLWTSIAMHALFNAIAVLAWAFTGDPALGCRRRAARASRRASSA